MHIRSIVAVSTQKLVVIIAVVESTKYPLESEHIMMPLWFGDVHDETKNVSQPVSKPELCYPKFVNIVVVVTAESFTTRPVVQDICSDSKARQD